MESMNIHIEYVQYVNTDKSYLIIEDGEDNNKRVFTGAKAEVYASYLNNALTEIYKSK